MEMVKRYSLLFATVISFVFFTAGYAQQTKTYVNKKLNYSINYPADYELKPLGDIVVFVSPEKDKEFAFSANVNVAARILDKEEVNLKEFCQEGKVNILKSMKNAKFLDEGKEKISNSEAYRLVYTSQQNKADFKFMEVVFINRNMVYVITYTSLLGEYDRYLKQAKAIINSFKILEPPPLSPTQ
jgi:hypothetical protein